MERSMRTPASVFLLLAIAASPAAPPALARLQVSFKLDPRLTRSLYMGDRWVSPPSYTRVQDGKDLIVEAKVHGLNARGEPAPVHATWRSADPEIVTVSRAQGQEVTLTIRRAGRTHIAVAYDDVSSKLAVDAVLHQGVLRVDISQDGAKPAPAREASAAPPRSHSRNMQAEARNQIAERNKKEGEAFRAANRAKEGVVTRPSGLQYRVLEAGDGPKPTLADTVVLHYRGTLVDGTEFDNSIKRGAPAPFKLRRMIRGWREALLLMPVGSRWEIVIPPSLAYGRRGTAPRIGPNATLVFEVELILIKPKPRINQKPATAQEAASAAPSLARGEADAGAGLATQASGK